MIIIYNIINILVVLCMRGTFSLITKKKRKVQRLRLFESEVLNPWERPGLFILKGGGNIQKIYLKMYCLAV
jgi:hypothetical protein